MSSLAEKLARFDDSPSLEHARTIPSEWYFDPEIAAAERRFVFSQTWQAVGRVDQLTEPGCFLSIDVAGEPIVVVRDEDGNLRAFANVCRHRAARVVPQAEGKTSRLRCRYHGWTYDLCGRLRGTPEFDGVADFARQDNGLPSFAVDTCGPFVFVHPGEVKQTLADYLAPFAERVAPLDIGNLKFAGRRQYEMDCNWKIFVDNFQDGGYHLNTLHPSLSGAINYSGYRTENFSMSSVQVSPMRTSSDETVAKVRSGENAYYWWIFPNFMINVYEGVMDTNLVLPLGPNRCRVIFDFFFADVETEEAKRFNAESIAIAHQIQLEDQEISEEVQRGLSSNTYDTGRFRVKRESGGCHFHRLLAQALHRAVE